MTNGIFGNNQVCILGKVTGTFRFSHELYGEKFYSGFVSVTRLSGTHDIIPVMVSDRLIDVTLDYNGCYIQSLGQFRSYDNDDGISSKLVLFVFAMKISVFNQEASGQMFLEPNRIILDGFICREPIHRISPMGRKITDVMLAVNRKYGKYDHIPCVFWGRNAKIAAKLEIGSHLLVFGRIQSREYKKRITEDTVAREVAYEVSVASFQYIPYTSSDTHE